MFSKKFQPPIYFGPLSHLFGTQEHYFNLTFHYKTKPKVNINKQVIRKIWLKIGANQRAVFIKPTILANFYALLTI